jgi:hypothetical protein
MFLLRRNWFLDRQDVFGLFDELSEDVFCQVFDRRHELPNDVQEYFAVTEVPTTKTVIRNISDSEWEKLLVKHEEVRIAHTKKRKSAFVAPPRPRETIDILLDNVQTRLTKKQEALDDMVRMMNRNRTFSQRKQEEDPMVRDTRAEVETLKNEFEWIKTKILTYDKLWTESSFLDALHSGAAALPATS